MKIPINYLQERFPVFAYSTLQKYKADKESKHFFGSKKDFYIFLEANYILELKSRRKLINFIDIKDVYFFSFLENLENYIYKNNIIDSLINNLKEIKLNSIAWNDLVIEDKENNSYKYKQKIYKKTEIIEYLEKKFLQKNNITHFDEWVFLKMIINLKKYTEYLKYLEEKIISKNKNLYDEMEIDPIEHKVKIKTPNNQEQIFFFEKNKKSNKIIIKEKINSLKEQNNNKRIKLRVLQEPKWVINFNENRDLYLDHSFNFIEINYKKNYFQYNLVKFPIHFLFFEKDSVLNKKIVKKTMKNI